MNNAVLKLDLFHLIRCSKIVENEVKDGEIEEPNGKISKSKRLHCNKCEKKFNKEATYKIHMTKIHQETVMALQTENKIQSELTFQDKTRTLRSYKKKSSAQGPNN